MVKTAVLVSGGGANLQAILDSCYFSEIPNFELSAVISSNPHAYALERAQGAKIPAYVVDRSIFPNHASFTNALQDKLHDLDIELVITAGFREKLGYTILHKYKNRVINTQPALFPAFCSGYFDPLEALTATLRLGVRVSGATAYFMTEEDNGIGPIILQQQVEVRQEDDPATLQDRLMREGEWVVLPKAISLYCEGRLTLRGERVIISSPPGRRAPEKEPYADSPGEGGES